MDRRCPSCDRLAEVVLPTLQMLERRVAALEDGAAVRVAAGPHDQVEAGERDLLVGALRACRGVQSHAAQLLGISARRMHYRVHKYGLEALCPLRKK